jgi:hypothetical protein
MRIDLVGTDGPDRSNLPLQAPVLCCFTWRLHEVTGSVDWEVPHEDEKLRAPQPCGCCALAQLSSEVFKASRLNLATR